MAEAAGTDVRCVALADLDRVACNRDFCRWQQMGLVILAPRGRDRIEGAAMAPACAAADVVLSERWLPRECVARWLTISRATPAESRGLALYIGSPPHTALRPPHRHPHPTDRTPRRNAEATDT